MNIFYSNDICGDLCRFDRDESSHMVRVLRYAVGDKVNAVDGEGNLYFCELLEASPEAASARVVKVDPGWGTHPYELIMAVCPTKNSDRYEWFAEKVTELGVDRIVPIISMHSERRVLKKGRVERVVKSAMKQSLKAVLPVVEDAVSAFDYIARFSREEAGAETLKLIAYCFDDTRKRLSVKEALENFDGRRVVVLIGPEGDFFREEAEAAVAAGFIPVHLGVSRLRTETAAVTAAAAVYFRYMQSLSVPLRSFDLICEKENKQR